MLPPAPLVHHTALHRLELLLLVRREHLADLLHGRDMRHMEVNIFRGNGQQLLLHFGEIDRFGLQQGRHIQPQRGYLGLETNHLLGMIVEDGAYLGALLVRELELLRHPVEVLLEPHALMPHAPLVPSPAVLVLLLLVVFVRHHQGARGVRSWERILLRPRAWHEDQRAHKSEGHDLPSSTVHYGSPYRSGGSYTGKGSTAPCCPCSLRSTRASWVAQVVLLAWRTPPQAKSFPVREAFRGGPVRL